MIILSTLLAPIFPPDEHKLLIVYIFTFFNIQFPFQEK